MRTFVTQDPRELHIIEEALIMYYDEISTYTEDVWGEVMDSVDRVTFMDQTAALIHELQTTGE